MNIDLAPMYPWQKQAFDCFETGFSEGKRLTVFNTGRRSGKTDLLVRIGIFWTRGILAGGSVAYCGPSEELIADPKSWMKHWMSDLITGPNARGDGYTFSTGGSISFVSLSAGKISPLRGLELNCIIVDEAAHSPHLRQNLIDILDANAWPTLALSGGPVLIASTPKGLGNDFHTLWKRAGQEGTRFTGPSTMNPNFSLKELEQERRSRPELVFRQEFEAQFVDFAGALLKRSEVKYGAPPPLESFRTIAFGVDPAISEKQTADFTGLAVCGVDRQNRYWVLKLMQYRLDWPSSMQKIIGLAEAWHPHIIVVEEVSFSKLVVQQLAAAGLPVKPVAPEADKITRFEAIHTHYCLGNVWHAENLDSDCEGQLFAFPETKHDDVVDALVYGLGYLIRSVRTAWSVDQGSGEHWGSGMAHERKREVRLYDFWGNVHTRVVDDDDEDKDSAQGSAPNPVTGTVSVTPPPSGAPVQIGSNFSEGFVGDELVVTATDGRELMRLPRGKSHLYYWQKQAGKLPFQKEKI
jgi:predicted phage terminase large subunit-like protein